MSASELQNLSRRERQIMNLVFQHGELTAQQVMDQLPDPPGYATVRSLLRILEEKGHLKHYKSGRQFVYQPVKSPEKIRNKSLSQVLKTFFGGSITEAVATFINDSEADLNHKKHDKLAKIIKETKKKKNK